MQAPIVCVVDDDLSIRESLDQLIRCEGWRAALFACATDFLASPSTLVASCLVLDVTLPDLDGLEVQRRVVAEQRAVPIIFVTGRCDVPLAVRAMKAGAIEFLTKPLDATALLAAIRTALAISAASHDQALQLQALRASYKTLSAREREVMALVVAGRLNKQIADELGISEITVKAHRGKMMRKMHAASLAELVRMDAKLHLAARDRPCARDRPDDAPLATCAEGP